MSYVCLQIGGKFCFKWKCYAIDIAYFKCYSMMQSMLLVVMDISSIIMKFAIFSFFMTLLGVGRIDKYPCTGMWNVMCTIITMEHKKSVIVFIIADNNTFLPSVWKCCVMYFTKKVFPLPTVVVKTCKLCGFSIKEWNLFIIHDLITSLKGLCQMCV